MRPPRAAEALLRGFLADRGLEEAILGDLVEEWRERVATTGSVRADAWYWEQVLRSVPHLLGEWWRQQSLRRAVRSLGRVALVLLLSVSLAGVTCVVMSILAGGAPGEGGPDVTRAILVAGSGWAGVAGFVLALRTSDPPMVSAVLLGLSWLPTTSLAALMHPSPGPPDWFFAAYPALPLALTLAGGAVATMLRGSAPRKRALRRAPDTPTLEEAMKTDDSPCRRAVRPALAAAFVLMVPLVAMQFTDEVVWTLSDFVVMGALVFGTGLLFELVLTKTESAVSRAGAGLALGTAFLLVWVNLAVGVIGAAGHGANLMYAGVLAVGIGGVVGAGFEPRGMARALVATALAQVAAGGVALIAAWGSSWHVFGLTAMFTALWLVSAWLFRYEARERSPASAMPAG